MINKKKETIKNMESLKNSKIKSAGLNCRKFFFIFFSFKYKSQLIFPRLFIIYISNELYISLKKKIVRKLEREQSNLILCVCTEETRKKKTY